MNVIKEIGTTELEPALTLLPKKDHVSWHKEFLGHMDVVLKITSVNLKMEIKADRFVKEEFLVGRRLKQVAQLEDIIVLLILLSVFKMED